MKVICIFLIEDIDREYYNGYSACSEGTGKAVDVITDPSRLLAAPKTHKHHIFPKSMKDWFEKRGINIDNFTVELSEGVHLKGVHGKGGFVGPGNTFLQGKFNDAWKIFIRNHPDATAKEVYQYAGKLNMD